MPPLRTLVVASLLFGSGLPAQTPDSVTLRLRPGDGVRLQIVIPGFPNTPLGSALEPDYPVMDDGVALLPMIGLVDVAGRPFPEVRAEVRERYRDELGDVTVRVTPLLRVAVLGEVRQPGLIPVDPTFTVADLIAAVGGLTPRGDPGKVTLLREGQPMRISLEVEGDGRARSLRPGDQIVVGRQSWIRENLNLLLPSAASVLAAAITTLILR